MFQLPFLLSHPFSKVRSDFKLILDDPESLNGNNLLNLLDFP